MAAKPDQMTFHSRFSPRFTMFDQLLLAQANVTWFMLPLALAISLSIAPAVMNYPSTSCGGHFGCFCRLSVSWGPHS